MSIPDGSRPRGMTDGPYWLHELSYSSLESTDSGYTQQPWLPDELCGHCMLCQERFHLWRWTHHCRDCGGIFCNQCSSHRIATAHPPPAPKTIRVCDRCASSHPEHLGCEWPLSCSRCSTPRTVSHFIIYLQLFLRLLICCVLCPFGTWCKASHVEGQREGATSGFSAAAAARRA